MRKTKEKVELGDWLSWEEDLTQGFVRLTQALGQRDLLLTKLGNDGEIETRLFNLPVKRVVEHVLCVAHNLVGSAPRMNAATSDKR